MLRFSSRLCGNNLQLLFAGLISDHQAHTQPSGFLDILSSEPNSRTLSSGSWSHLPGVQVRSHVAGEEQREPHPGRGGLGKNKCSSASHQRTRGREICSHPGWERLAVCAVRTASKVPGDVEGTSWRLSLQHCGFRDKEQIQRGEIMPRWPSVSRRHGEVYSRLLPSQARPSLRTESRDEQVRTHEDALGNRTQFFLEKAG